MQCKLLKKYTKIRKKNLVGKKFGSEPAYGDSDKYIKTKIKFMDIMYIQVKKRPKENTSYKCLSLIMLDSVVKVNKKYHPEKLLKV